MADKFLNNTGLNYYHNRIKTLFADKTTVDGLSTDVADAKRRLTAIEEDMPTKAGMLVDDTSQEVTFNTVDGVHAWDVVLSNNPDGDSNVQLNVFDENGEAQGFTTMLASKAYVDANGGAISQVKVNNVALPIVDKSVNVTVPTKVSDLTNDSQFQTATEVQSAISSAVASAYKYKGSVPTVGDLPSTGQVVGDVYDVQSTGVNYAWDGTAWDALGAYVDTSVLWTSVTGQTNTLEAITTAEIDNIISA